MTDISEQQDLVTILKIKLRETCKSLRMFSEAELVGERGSKVSKKNAPNAICSPYMLIIKDERYLKCGNGSTRLKKRMV